MCRLKPKFFIKSNENFIEVVPWEIKRLLDNHLWQDWKIMEIHHWCKILQKRVIYISWVILGTLSNVFQRGFKTLTLKTFFLNTLIDNGFHTDSMFMRQLGKLKGSDIRFLKDWKIDICGLLLFTNNSHTSSFNTLSNFETRKK